MRALTASVLLLASLITGFGASSDPRPNVVFIMTDDHGAWAMTGGHPDALTPNLDRLRAQGAVLSDYYTPTPVCSPARASLLTSRYGTELGITDYLRAGPREPAELPEGTPTWPAVLARSGYHTGLFGKYHCGNGPNSHPTRAGYQEFAGFIIGAEISVDPEMELKGQTQRMPGWTDDIVTDYALDFIGRHQAEPFAVSIHFWAPHANTQNKSPDGDRTWLPVSKADWEPYEQLEPRLPEPDYPQLDVARNRRMLREYLASVHSADRNVGRILDRLAALGLERNTLVIFTGDNGFNIGQHGIWHKGNGRWLLLNQTGDRPNMWDTSLRVPALVRWPQVIPAGRVIGQTLSHLDWFPTLAALAHADLPQSVVVRGRNFLPLLEGTSGDWPEDFYAQYTMRGGATMRSYQTTRWKLIRYINGEYPDEFYDRIHDPAERDNLQASADPEVQKARNQLETRLRQKMQEIADPALQKTPIAESKK